MPIISSEATITSDFDNQFLLQNEHASSINSSTIPFHAVEFDVVNAILSEKWHENSLES